MSQNSQPGLFSVGMPRELSVRLPELIRGICEATPLRPLECLDCLLKSLVAHMLDAEAVPVVGIGHRDHSKSCTSSNLGGLNSDDGCQTTPTPLARWLASYTSCPAFMDIDLLT